MIKINLIDYAGNKVPVELDDNTDKISGVILSGDMVMEKPFHKDTSNCREVGFYDGVFEISKKNFDELNKCKSSYEAQMLN